MFAARVLLPRVLQMLTICSHANHTQVYEALWTSAQPQSNPVNHGRVDASFAESLLPMREDLTALMARL